jgi:carboxyl-terminal processing protease
VSGFPIIAYDREAREYHMWSFASIAEMPLEFTGRFQRSNLVWSRYAIRTVAGLGIQSNPRKAEDDASVIRNVAPDSAAARASLRPGDRVTHLNGRPLRGMSSADVSALMRGKEGTEVRLTVERDGKAREVTLTRPVLNYNFLRTVVTLQPGGGYLEVVEVQVDGKWQKQSREA